MYTYVHVGAHGKNLRVRCQHATWILKSVSQNWLHWSCTIQDMYRYTSNLLDVCFCKIGFQILNFEIMCQKKVNIHNSKGL